jgi:hypothetical protein
MSFDVLHVTNADDCYGMKMNEKILRAELERWQKIYLYMSRTLKRMNQHNKKKSMKYGC